MVEAAQSRPRDNVRKAKSELYRQLIFEAAERNFAESGVEETKMEEIAAESGLSLATLYTVFSGKAQLVAAIHDMRLREILQRTVDVARGAGSPLESLLRGVRSYMEFFVVHPDYLRMYLREGYAWGLGGKAIPTRRQAEAWREGVARQATLFARGIEQGLFYRGDPELMARMMIAMQQVQLADWVEREMQRSVEDLVEEMSAQVKRSFCPATAAGSTVEDSIV
jgi:AcrR family transcriptional regulator